MSSVQKSESHYRTIHRLKIEEIRSLLSAYEENEPMEDFLDILETLAECVPSKLTGVKLLYPQQKCFHCDEWITLRDDEEGNLWLWQGKEEMTMGILPMSHCPFPYHAVLKILAKHPDWRNRLRSSCKVCREEISFPTSHSCLVPEGIVLTSRNSSQPL